MLVLQSRHDARAGELRRVGGEWRAGALLEPRAAETPGDRVPSGEQGALLGTRQPGSSQARRRRAPAEAQPLAEGRLQLGLMCAAPQTAQRVESRAAAAPVEAQEDPQLPPAQSLASEGRSS